MTAWAVHGVELPYGDEPVAWWIDGSGAVHDRPVADAGARVAVHSTVPGAGQPVAAGVDSVEHGFGLDEDAMRDMAGRGTAWAPTIGALLALRARTPASWPARQPSWPAESGCGDRPLPPTGCPTG